MVGERKRSNFWTERLITDSAEKSSLRGAPIRCGSRGKSGKGFCILVRAWSLGPASCVADTAAAHLFDLEVPSVCTGPDVKWDLFQL